MYIMKKQTQWMYLMLALLPLAACTHDDEDMRADAVPGRVIFVMSTNDKASTRTQTDKSGVTSFASDDEVGIFATKTEGKKTTELTANSLYKSTAQEDGSLTWNSMDADKMKGATTFYAYYPYNAKNTARSSIVHTVRTDQSVEEGYNQSDLLTAIKSGVTTSVSGDQLIELDFDHKLAMVQVEVTGPGVKNAPADFRLTNVQTIATVNFDKKPDDALFLTTSGNVTDVAMLKVSERIVAGMENNRILYRAVVPAQTLVADNPMLYFSMGGFIYTPSHSQDIELTAGKKRTLVVKLSDKGSVLFVKDEGIADWGEDADEALSDKVYEGDDAMPLVPSFPELTAETKLPEAVTDYPENGYKGWWFKFEAGKKSISFKEEADRPYVEIQLDNKAFLSYWFGSCAVAGSMKYRLTFDYNGGKDKEFTGIAVIDRRDGKNYCFRPIGSEAGTNAAGALSDKVVNEMSNAVMIPYTSDWTSYSYDFDLSQSGVELGKFAQHPGSRELDNLGVVVAGRIGKWTTARIANIKFEPILE